MKIGDALYADLYVGGQASQGLAGNRVWQAEGSSAKRMVCIQRGVKKLLGSLWRGGLGYGLGGDVCGAKPAMAQGHRQEREKVLLLYTLLMELHL